MILEVAVLNVRAGESRAFERAFAEAQGIISSMPGYVSHQLQRRLESKDRYLLLVHWQKLDDHTIGFRQSPQYQDWKRLLHDFYEPFPTVEHYEPVFAAQEGAPADGPASLASEAVVQRQLDAYNARDIGALLAVYADDAQVFEHPATLLATGSAALRERFLVRFQEPNLHAALLKRMVMGNIVVDHEEVTRTFSEGTGKLALVMIYEVTNGRITKAWSIAGAKTLDVRS